MEKIKLYLKGIIWHELDRAAGSTMKPIFDYAPAIEYLKWATYHQIDDSPFKYSTGQEVRNADRSHMGPITMREALKCRVIFCN